MDLTSLTTSVINSSTLNFESWFIPLDILTMVLTALTVGLSILFILIIIIYKTCHTVSMMLVFNTCLSILICASDALGMTIFALQNDLKQIQYQDSFCIFRGYLSYTSCAVMNYSFLLHALYRYVMVVYPTRLFWQSIRFQLLFIGITWIFSFIYPIGFILNNDIIYNVNNQICQLPLRLSFSVIFAVLCIYMIPVSLTMFIYFKLVRYVKAISKRVTPANILARARRELQMFQRIIILVTILLVLGIPYTIFILMSFFTNPPKYHFRIACSAIYVSLACIIITLFQFTPLLKSSLMKIINVRPNVVIPTVAHGNR